MFSYIFGNKKRSNKTAKLSKNKVIEELVKKLEDKNSLESRIEGRVSAMISNMVQSNGNRLLQEGNQKVETLREASRNEIEQLRNQLKIKEKELDRLRNLHACDARSTSLRRFTTCDQINLEEEISNETSTLDSSLIHQVVGHTGGLPNNEYKIKANENRDEEFSSLLLNNTPHFSDFVDRERLNYFLNRVPQNYNHTNSIPTTSQNDDEKNQIINALLRQLEEAENNSEQTRRKRTQNNGDTYRNAPKRSDSRVKHLLKMLPKYSGDPNENIEEWFYSLERYFEKAETPDDELVDFAQDFLSGSAKVAFKSLKANQLNWRTFKTVFIEWFQPADYQAMLRNSLIKVQQTGKMQDYIHEFDSITNNIKNMAEEDKITYFIRGLKPFTAGFVKQRKCKTLIEAKKEALSADSNFGGYFQSRNNNDSNFYRQTSLRLPNNRSQTNENNINDNDLEKCHKCGNIYHPGLKCSEAKVLDAETINLAHRSSTENELLKVKALINNVEIESILDTGATRSVLSEEIVREHNIPIKSEQMNIALANGELFQAQTTELVPVIIKGIHSKISFVVVPNKNIEVLIGLDWLRQNKVAIEPLTNTIKIGPEKIKLKEEEEEKTAYLASNYNELGCMIPSGKTHASNSCIEWHINSNKENNATGKLEATNKRGCRNEDIAKINRRDLLRPKTALD